MKKIKIDVISGFLGAGKTTLIRKFVKEATKNEKVVIIENEFGKIGVDGGFLKDAGIELKELNSGCICCSLVGDFKKAIADIIAQYNPDRIIIEPSGVGKLSDVQKAILDATEVVNIEFNTGVTVVDVTKCKMYMKNFGEFFNDQIKYATSIVLSRTDIANDEKIDTAIELIRTINDTANIITTNIAELSGEKLLEVIESKYNLADELMDEVNKHHHDHDECGHGHHHHHDEECGCGHHHHHDEECGCGHHHHHDEECGHGHHHHHDEECGCGHHHHDHDECGHDHSAPEVFVSCGIENYKPISKAKLEEILEEISESTDYGIILRMKGMVKSLDTDEWYYFDLVPGEYEIRTGQAMDMGRVCVIGSNLAEDKIKDLLNSR